MSMILNHISINDYSRPGLAIKKIKGIVIHWTANPKSSAIANRNFFENRKDGKSGYGSAHYIIGLAGERVQVMPENEIAYHVGAKSYKTGIVDKLSDWPNNCTIGIECCHLDWDGNMTDETVKSLIDFTKSLMSKYKLTKNDIYLHYDIGSQIYDFRGVRYTGKPCHYYFVKNPEKWEEFKNKLEV